MDCFECYCFVCSGPVSTPEVGSLSPPALRNRRRRVEAKRLASRAGVQYDSDASDPEEEEVMHDEWDVAPEHELETYDPHLVTPERTGWIRKLRVLGFNPKAVGSSKAWVSRIVKYDGRGGIEVIDKSDPNQPSIHENRFYDCYESTKGNEVVFPFHHNCMVVLKEAYKWTINNTSRKTMRGLDSSTIDMDSLYEAATVLSDRYAVYLRLDYGGISGANQTNQWEAEPGEEYSVIDPAHSAAKTIELPLVSTASQSLYSRTRSSIDPFGAVPNEIIHSICNYLPGEDLSNFLIASFVAHSATREPTFWKSFGCSRMPWAWELWKRTSWHESQSGPPIDYKKLYFLVDARTSHPFGMTTSLGDWMGWANRRRIWTTCLQLLSQYFRSRQGAVSDNEISSDITDSSIEGELFPVSYPPAIGTTLQTFMLHSWEELRVSPFILEAYWGLDQNLVGLGISCGINKRVLGTDAASESGGGHGITKSASRINTGEWIQSLSLGLKILQPLRGTAVKRVDITLTSGRQITLGDGQQKFANRQLVCFNGYTFVGLFGQSGHNGAIGSLGILQCPTPKTLRDTTSRKLSIAKRLLWHPWTSSIAHDRDVHLRPLFILEDSCINALTPHEAFSWGESAEQLSKLTRISARLCSVPGSTGFLQVQCAFVRRLWEQNRGVGLNTGAIQVEWSKREKDSTIHHFDINGPGGERIIGIKAQRTNGKITAITFCTNRGRQVTFGQETQDEWATFEETVEESIIGLEAAFSMSVDPYEKHFFLMNSIMVLTKKQDS